MYSYFHLELVMAILVLFSRVIRPIKCQSKLYDIILQNMTDVIIPIKSPINEAINTYLIFLIHQCA